MKQKIYIIGIVGCLLAFVPAIYFIGLNRDIDVSSISGVYQVGKVSKLRLNTDGSYVHEYISRDGAKLNEGKWTIENMDGQKAVVLSGAQFLPDEGVNACGVSKGWCYLAIHKLFDKIELIYDIDLNLGFKKLRTK